MQRAPSMAAEHTRGRTSRLRVRAAVSLVMLAALAAAVPAAAGDNDSAVADALFQAAKELASQQNYAEACPKFEASYKLDPTLGTLLNLADCHEKLGKVASAWTRWGEAVDKATRAGDKRADSAKGRRDALTERLPKLTIEVHNPVAGLQVQMDDVTLDGAVFGLPLPVDPGKHVIAVVRDGKRLKEQPVELAEKATEKVELDLAAIEKAAPPARSDKPASSAPAPPASSASSPPPAPPKSKQRIAGAVLMGAGAGVAMVAGGLLAAAVSKKDDANSPDDCQDKVCTPAGFNLVQQARGLAEAGQWVGVGSVVVFVVGATILATAPAFDRKPGASSSSRPSPLRNAWIAPWATARSGGVSVGGTL